MINEAKKEEKEPKSNEVGGEEIKIADELKSKADPASEDKEAKPTSVETAKTKGEDVKDN